MSDATFWRRWGRDRLERPTWTRLQVGHLKLFLCFTLCSFMSWIAGAVMTAGVYHWLSSADSQEAIANRRPITAEDKKEFSRLHPHDPAKAQCDFPPYMAYANEP